MDSSINYIYLSKDGQFAKSLIFITARECFHFVRHTGGEGCPVQDQDQGTSDLPPPCFLWPGPVPGTPTPPAPLGPGQGIPSLPCSSLYPLPGPGQGTPHPTPIPPPGPGPGQGTPTQAGNATDRIWCGRYASGVFTQDAFLSCKAHKNHSLIKAEAMNWINLLLCTHILC